MESGELSDSQEVTLMLNTFQTVKLSLETWTLINNVMRQENLTLSESVERLVRHGYTHYQEIYEAQFPLRHATS